MFRVYKREWHYFKRDYSRSFLAVLLVSLAVALLTYWSLVNQPGLAEETMKRLEEQFRDKGLRENMTQHELFRLILVNNVMVSLLMLVLGLVPVVFLPAISAVGTFASVGILLAYNQIKGQNLAHLIFFGLLPHGLVEVVSMLFTSSVGIFLSRTVVRKLFSGKRAEISIRKAIVQSGRSFLLVSLPLILFAALIEGYITPVFLTLFMER